MKLLFVVELKFVHVKVELQFAASEVVEDFCNCRRCAISAIANQFSAAAAVDPLVSWTLLEKKGWTWCYWQYQITRSTS